MIPKWFANRGQVIQIGIAFIALLLAAYVAFPQMSLGAFFTPGAILFYLLVLLGGSFYFTAARKILSHSKESLSEVETSEEEYRSRASFDETRITPGNFWSVDAGLHQIKITFHGLVDEEGSSRADLEINLSGGVHGGTMTKRIDRDRYLVPSTSKYLAESGSLFSFHSAKDSMAAIIIRVEHINPHTKEALLSVGQINAYKNN